MPPRGWFIPHRYASLLPAPGTLQPYAGIDELFARHADTFTAMIELVDTQADALLGLEQLFDQAWFPGLDAAVAYALVRQRKPARIIEVGSGHSTRILARAMDGMGQILAIDPAPRADIAGLQAVRLLRSTLQEASVDLFDTLCSGDVLFIDSSHILMPGSDVDILLNRVLPILPSGVLIHLHDIFLPYD